MQSLRVNIIVTLCSRLMHLLAAKPILMLLQLTE